MRSEPEKNLQTSSESLLEERRALAEHIRGMNFDAAWQEIRIALEATPPLRSDSLLPTVYEGPTRSLLLPLPFELLRDLLERPGAQAIDCIAENAADPHPLVAAYCMHALSDLEDPRLIQAAAGVADRPERILTIFGCFVWEGTLAEYGRKLLNEKAETLEPDHRGL